MDRNSWAARARVAQDGSLSARRVWIEIGSVPRLQRGHGVALRKESVDRNFNPGRAARPRPVALRKESVDRNLSAG